MTGLARSALLSYFDEMGDGHIEFLCMSGELVNEHRHQIRCAFRRDLILNGLQRLDAEAEPSDP
jgi:hypothetical protein